jgi:hypothetical protein
LVGKNFSENIIIQVANEILYKKQLVIE